ncbi:hypothetical protein SCLARK_00948 [Spiroplasma clarkii]|uniref:hypothetical protein n=1 Tax=Spiroplasma clarkii TaxID=2139 RepID=UPI000B582909|nr:hypothetical protein [Spiroplasma clarkii]ARU91555.1 hypothetical protein SCLARK_00948 [Spiroplasma clarkii]
MKRNYRGKRQMKTNKHIQDIIREAALSRDKAAKRELLIKSGGSRSWFYDAIKNTKKLVRPSLSTKIETISMLKSEPICKH